MTTLLHRIRFAAAGLLLVLAACGGGGDDADPAELPPPPPPAAAVIGAAGGSVTGGTGATVVVPAGALATEVNIAVEQTSAGSPALPGGLAAIGPMLAFTPHGTAFAVPVTMTLPFDPALLPAGATPQLFKTNAQGQWEQVANASFGANSVSAEVTGFSFVQVVVPALQRNDPLRIWTFFTHPANGFGLAPLPLPNGSGSLSGGTLEEVVEFGAAPFDQPIVGTTQTLPPDGKANGFVFSSANGVTYLVSAEAPYNRAVDGVGPIGSRTHLKQLQSFVKRASDARLTFTLTHIDLEVQDFNTRADLSRLIYSEVLLAVGAYKTSANYFFMSAAKASVRGRGSLYIPDARNESFSRTPMWDISDFDMSITDVSYEISNGTCPGKRGRLVLKAPRTYTVNLSSVAVGETFTLRVDTYADALNRRGGEPVGDCQASSARAYLRDPQQIGGTALAFTGLEATNQPLPEPPEQPLVAPAACVPGPGPNAAAGVLQFSAAAYAVGEQSGAEQTVTVTRSGGSSGAVTATISSSDGTALAGTDYTALRSTVFFADGDDKPRSVTLPITANVVGGQFNRTVNLALSQPGNCVALGPQASSVVSIIDDDPVPVGFGLDPSFGTLGETVLDRFGGDRSGMALQADGKIVMVGGTFTDFILARFNADGSVDRSFGIDGKVTTDMGSGFIQEEALAVAVQADGKIVVVGHTSIDNRPPNPDGPPTFALARYNPDGSLDTSFGTGGRVSGSVNGIARAVAIQPDGKIVLAGDFTLRLSNGSSVSDFTVARFNANGNLDLPFGTSGTGQVATDIGSIDNRASNIVLQPDGAIVVSGAVAKAVTSDPAAPEGHTDIVRYSANGTLDAGFGVGGKITMPALQVGEGLALQADGKLVLVGSVVLGTSPATARFVLLRLNANGTPDNSFGSAGQVDTAFTQSAKANAVALQADGKIVVVGASTFVAVSDFIVARYNSNGTLDAGFGIAGVLELDFFNAGSVAESVLVQPDGRIVVGGVAGNSSGFDGYGVARILP